jgi:hypothetical protein
MICIASTPGSKFSSELQIGGQRSGEIMSDGELKIAYSVAENVNVAFYQNAVPFLRELTLENNIGRDLGEVVVHLFSEPPFVTLGVWRVDRISDKTTHHIHSLDVKLDPVFLTGAVQSFVGTGERLLRLDCCRSL